MVPSLRVKPILPAVRGAERRNFPCGPGLRLKRASRTTSCHIQETPIACPSLGTVRGQLNGRVGSPHWHVRWPAAVSAVQDVMVRYQMLDLTFHA